MKILELKNVNKSYPKFSLKNISFGVEAGSITGFIGRNGAGKTTTLKGIMNLIHFDSGEVNVFGRSFFESELDNRQHISFSLSEINFFPNSTLKSLTSVTSRFYRDWNDDVYQKLCNKFNLDQSKKIKELSSGMKVKYNLAIALSHNAKLLILDEPTSGLDPISRDEILDIFKSLVKSGERAILFSTHITSDLEKCADHIVYIKDGAIIADKSKSNFIDDYRLVGGDKSLLEEIKDKLVSYKIEGDKFTALIKKECVGVANFEDVKIPDLETVMVYNEREKENEEFII